jgi:uncharacterized protein YbjQ (UPF0145 family)
MKQKEILITASDNIPYTEIENHYGMVDSQIVIGANIFRDVFAGFRDLVGGETKGYKKDLDRMKKAALADVKEQAKQRKANAIISVRIDLDELSGGGKSMFMLNIYGSAVKLKESALHESNIESVIKEISFDDVEYFKRRNKIKKMIENSEDVAIEVILNDISEYDLWERQTSLNVLADSTTASRSLENNISEIPITHIEEFLTVNIDRISVHYWNLVYNQMASRNWYN